MSDRIGPFGPESIQAAAWAIHRSIVNGNASGSARAALVAAVGALDRDEAPHKDSARRGAFLAGDGTLTFAELEKWAEEFGANAGSAPTGDPAAPMMVVASDDDTDDVGDGCRLHRWMGRVRGSDAPCPWCAGAFGPEMQRRSRPAPFGYEC